MFPPPFLFLLTPLYLLCELYSVSQFAYFLSASGSFFCVLIYIDIVMCLYENKYNSMNNQSFCCVVWMSKQTTSDYEYEVRVILWMEDGQLLNQGRHCCTVAGIKLSGSSSDKAHLKGGVDDSGMKVVFGLVSI